MRISPGLVLTVLLLGLAYATFTPFNFGQPNRAEIDRSGGLVFRGYSTAYPAVPPAKIAHCDSFTLVLRLQTALGGGQGCIFDYAREERYVNLRAEQYGDDLIFSVGTAGPRQRAYLALSHALKVGEPITVILFFDGQTLSGWQSRGGVQKSTLPAGSHLRWDSTATLTLASTINGKFEWYGTLWSMTFFDRILTLDDVVMNEPGPDTPDPLLSYDTRSVFGRMIPDHGRAPAVDLTVPEGALVPGHDFLESPASYWHGRAYVSDIIMNILVFIPLGFLAALVARNQITRYWPAFLVAVGAILLCTFCIEIIQHYLPTRNSSVMDIVSNTVGGATGAWLASIAWPHRVLHAVGIRFTSTNES
jgi:hypothetical protein